MFLAEHAVPLESAGRDLFRLVAFTESTVLWQDSEAVSRWHTYCIIPCTICSQGLGLFVRLEAYTPLNTLGLSVRQVYHNSSWCCLTILSNCKW